MISEFQQKYQDHFKPGSSFDAKIMELDETLSALRTRIGDIEKKSNEKGEIEALEGRIETLQRELAIYKTMTDELKSSLQKSK